MIYLKTGRIIRHNAPVQNIALNYNPSPGGAEYDRFHHQPLPHFCDRLTSAEVSSGYTRDFCRALRTLIPFVTIASL